MKRNRKRYLFLVITMLTVHCFCVGCSSAPEEAMADYAVQGSEDETENGGAENGRERAADISADSDGINAEETKDSQEDTAAEETKQDRMEETVNEISGNSIEPGESEHASAGKPRREPVKVKGIYVSGPAAGISRMDELIELVDQTELNAMVIDIKNDEGKVTYDMQSEQVLEIESGIGYIPDIDALVSKCKEKDIYLIARIVAFRDPYLAEKKPEWAVHTKDGEIFRDKSGLAWVNPYQREVWDYLVEIAEEAAEAGFDEIQFDYIRFSTDIKTDEAEYGTEADRVDKIEIITEFTEYMYDKLAPLGVYVAADVFGTVIENETDQAIVGQDYVRMAEHLDYICPMIYPSHYRNGSYGIAVPDADPYHTIFGACSASVQELSVLPEEGRARVRAWLQSFTAGWVPGHISYGPKQIREEIKGAYDAGYEEWILWNAAVKYQRDSLLTEEEAEAERQQWEAEKQEAERLEAEQEEAGKERAEKEQEEQEKQEEKKRNAMPGEDEETDQPAAAQETDDKESPEP